MKYWWVNQNQTYRHEVSGGYLWSPKLRTDGRHTRAYDLMRVICPGDVIFSFADTQIKAIGISLTNCYEFPKPTEFGNAGQNWSDIGWRVDVAFKIIPQPIRPRDFIAALRPFLPDMHSPLQPITGNGNQHSYLYDISEALAYALAQLMDRSVLDLMRGNAITENTPDLSSENIALWEDRVETTIKNSTDIGETEIEALIKARRGQGIFRKQLFQLERRCRVTKVNRSQHLIASHTKPWRDSTNEERLDPENGFMLTPTIDHLFGKGFISFDNGGDLIISPVAHQVSLGKMGIPIDAVCNVGSFSEGQKKYLDWHRERLLLKQFI